MAVYKSDQERQFAEWLTEGVDAGLFEPDWQYEPQKFEVVPKQRKDGSHVFHPATYEPDFRVMLTSLGQVAFPRLYRFRAVDDYVWFEIKGGYDPFRGDDRHITLKIKLMLHIFNVYVKVVKLPDYFQKDTWTPESMWWTKAGKPCKAKTLKGAIKIDEFIKRITGIQQELL